MAVGSADRDVVAARVVLLEHGNDLLGRKAVDRRHDRCVDQAAVRQRQEVETIVDHVELACAFEHRRDVQSLPGLRIQRRILRVAGRCRADEASSRNGIGSREQGDVDSSPDQPFRQQGGELFPRAVAPRRHAPRDRCQNRYPQRLVRQNPRHPAEPSSVFSWWRCRDKAGVHLNRTGVDGVDSTSNPFTEPGLTRRLLDRFERVLRTTRGRERRGGGRNSSRWELRIRPRAEHGRE